MRIVRSLQVLSFPLSLFFIVEEGPREELGKGAVLLPTLTPPISLHFSARLFDYIIIEGFPKVGGMRRVRRTVKREREYSREMQIMSCLLDIFWMSSEERKRANVPYGTKMRLSGYFASD